MSAAASRHSISADTATTSGKTAADEVLIKVTLLAPVQVIGGRSYCVFSSDDGKAKVPFPATLSFIARNGATKTYDAGCDDSWRDMTDALWLLHRGLISLAKWGRWIRPQSNFRFQWITPFRCVR